MAKRVPTYTCYAFGCALRELRKQKGITQEQLALQVGLDRTYVSNLELGRNSPSLDTMGKLSIGLGINLSRLIREFEDCLLQTRLKEQWSKAVRENGSN